MYHFQITAVSESFRSFLTDEPRLVISPSQLVYRAGDILTVTADARPRVHRLGCTSETEGEAIRKLIDENYNETTSEIVRETIIITEDMEELETIIKCMAVNNIEGRDYVASNNLSIKVEAERK